LSHCIHVLLSSESCRLGLEEHAGHESLSSDLTSGASERAEDSEPAGEGSRTAATEDLRAERRLGAIYLWTLFLLQSQIFGTSLMERSKESRASNTEFQASDYFTSSALGLSVLTASIHPLLNLFRPNF
jgi:hypothetical protein